MRSVRLSLRSRGFQGSLGQYLELVGPPLGHVVAPVVDGLPTNAELASQLRRGPKMANSFLSSHARECKACLTHGSSMPYGRGVTVRAQMRTNRKTWNERLVWALNERRMTKAELARACGVERASITEWANGKTKDPKLVPFFKACDALQVRPRWLALGEYPIEPLSSDTLRYSRDNMLETVTRLAEQLSAAEQRSVLNILQGHA
jgi:transcriptional regulator with XRE-family HTH domain